jgi:hypothetical protein
LPGGPFCTIDIAFAAAMYRADTPTGWHFYVTSSRTAFKVGNRLRAQAQRDVSSGQPEAPQARVGEDGGHGVALVWVQWRVRMPP